MKDLRPAAAVTHVASVQMVRHKLLWNHWACSRMCFPSRKAMRVIDYISAAFSHNSACQGETVRGWSGTGVIVIRVLQIKQVSRHRLLMVPPLAAVHDRNSERVEIAVPAHGSGACACTRVGSACVRARARLPTRTAHACVGVSAFLHCPGSALTLTTLRVRAPV